MAHLIKLELKKFGIARNIIFMLAASFLASFSSQYLYGIA
mgnify:CR=1 FL=1